MDLKKEIEGALKEAIRSKDTTKLNSLRMLLTALTTKEKELQRPLKEPEIHQVIGTAIKQRREAADQYRRGGREELAAEEEREMEILRSFLPEPLTPEALESLVREVIAQVGAKTPKDLGKVMKVLMPQVSGRADGKTVNETVRQLLSTP